jgi:hypothetical protein
MTAVPPATANFPSEPVLQEPIVSVDSIGHAFLPNLVEPPPATVVPSANALRYWQEALSLQSAKVSSDSMVQEMMLYTQLSLLRSGSVIHSSLPSSSTNHGGLLNIDAVELSSRPPADAFAATEEMLLYTNSITKSISMELANHRSFDARDPK